MGFTSFNPFYGPRATGHSMRKTSKGAMSSDWDPLETTGLNPDSSNPKTKELIAYYVALGAFTHVWSFWEYIFDLCIAIIYQRSKLGKNIGKKRPVISLSR